MSEPFQNVSKIGAPTLVQTFLDTFVSATTHSAWFLFLLFCFWMWRVSRRVDIVPTLINIFLHVKWHILRTFIRLRFVFVIVFSNKFRFPYWETIRIFEMKISADFAESPLEKNPLAPNDADKELRDHQEIIFNFRLWLISIRWWVKWGRWPNVVPSFFWIFSTIKIQNTRDASRSICLSVIKREMRFQGSVKRLINGFGEECWTKWGLFTRFLLCTANPVFGRQRE